MADLTTAIDTEIADVERQVAELRERLDEREAYRERLSQARVLLSNGNGAAPKPSVGKITQSPKKSGKPKPKRPTHDDAKAEAAKILALARARGEISASDVVDAGLADSIHTASSRLRNLNSKGDLHRSGERPSGKGGRPQNLYAPTSADAAPADADGAKTGPERRLVEALRTAPVALTTREVAKRAEVNAIDAGGVLAGLQRRGVIERVENGGTATWRLPA